jgi:hypothetical protein
MAKKTTKGQKRVAESKRMYLGASPEDFAETTPCAWIQQTKEGISYGVRAYGKSVRRNTTAALAEFARLKRAVEVDVPRLTAENLAEQLRASKELASQGSGGSAANDEGA